MPQYGVSSGADLNVLMTGATVAALKEQVRMGSTQNSAFTVRKDHCETTLAKQRPSVFEEVRTVNSSFDTYLLYIQYCCTCMITVLSVAVFQAI